MQPRLNFFCELDTPRLKELINDGLTISLLKRLNAGISLATRDFTADRAELVKQLIDDDIPVTCWLVLPEESGYWSNAGNSIETITQYESFKSWSVKYGLRFQAVGLDIEPDIRIFQKGLKNSWSILVEGTKQLLKFNRFSKARVAYRQLVHQIKSDGFILETYQLPIVVDERLAKSRLTQRFLGLLDLNSDREVLLLYSSFSRSLGAGLVWSYGKECRLLALGKLGEGRDINESIELINWNELERDLRLAYRWVNDIYIYSLEGCVYQNVMEEFTKFDWDGIILEPTLPAIKIERWRLGFQFILWLLTYIPILFLVGIGMMILIYSKSYKRHIS